MFSEYLLPICVTVDDACVGKVRGNADETSELAGVMFLEYLLPICVTVDDACAARNMWLARC